MSPPLFGGKVMLGKVGADGVDAVGATEGGDGRSKALALMSKALAHLDGDCNISPIHGAQLQMAIDALWLSVSRDQPSFDLH